MRIALRRRVGVRRRLVPALTVAMTATSLVLLAAPPSSAAVAMNDYVELPQTGLGEMVVLPGGKSVAVAGGPDDEVVVYDATSGTVTAIPGTDGVQSVEVDDDGAHLTGADPDGQRVVRIDLATKAVQSWPTPDLTPRDATFHDGRIVIRANRGYYSHTDFGAGYSLDPDSGVLSSLFTWYSGVSEVEHTGGRAVLVLEDGVLLLGPTGNPLHGFDDYALRDAAVSDEGTELFVRRAGEPFLVLDTTDLTEVGRSPLAADVRLEQVTSTQLVGRSATGTVVADRDDPARSTAYDPVDGGTPGHARLLEDGTLLQTARVGTDVRLYRSAVAGSAPVLVLDGPSLVGVGEPVALTGSLTGSGVAEGTIVEIRQTSPVSRTLATTTTGPGGTFSASPTFDAPVADAVLQAHTVVAGRALVASRVVRVTDEHYTIDVGVPSSAQPGTDIEQRGHVLLNGSPAPGVQVALRRSPWGCTSPSYLFDAISLGPANETGSFTSSLPAGPQDGWAYQVSIEPRPGWRWTSCEWIAIDRAEAQITFEEVPSGTLLAGEPLQVSLRVTAGGSPLPHAQVRMRDIAYYGFYPDFRWRELGRVTTNDEGRAIVQATAAMAGPHRFSADLTGNDLARDASAVSAPAHHVVLREGELTIDQMDTVPLGQTRAVTGTLAGTSSPTAVAVVVGGGDDGPITSTTQATTDSSGRFSVPVSFPRGPTTRVSVTSATGDVYSSASDSTTVEVVRPTPSIVGVWPATITVGEQLVLPIRGEGAVVGGYLNVQVDDGAPTIPSTYASKLETYNTALVVASQSWEVGSTHQVTLRYAGNATSAPTSRTASFTVQKRTTDLTFGFWNAAVVDPGQNFVIELDHNITSPDAGLTVTQPDGSTRTIAAGEEVYFRATAPMLPDGGTASWTFSWAGDSSSTPDTATWTATVRPPVAVSTDRTRYTIDDRAVVMIRPRDDRAHDVRVDLLSSYDADGFAWAGRVPADGRRLVVPVSVRGDLRVRVRNGASSSYDIVQPVRVGLALRSTALAPVARRDGYAVYRAGTRARVRAQATDWLGGCLGWQVQRRRAVGSWRPAGDITCHPTSLAGVSTLTTSAGAAGARFRARAAYLVNDRFLPSPSGWTYYRFGS